MADAREKNVYLAKLAEQAERYDEMAKYMEQVSAACVDGTSKHLSVEERNLLSVAYKNAVGSRRASWRIVNSVVTREQSKGNTENKARAEAYQKKVEAELDEFCKQVQEILKKLIEACNAEGDEDSSVAESRVFYQKMCGDYYRYQAEYACDATKEAHSQNAKESYCQAKTCAEKDLAVTHPIRLGLALNFSVFYYEVLNNPEEACKMARQAFEDAIAELDNVSEDSYKDSTLIMQLLRDNLTLWTSDAGDDAQ